VTTPNAACFLDERRLLYGPWQEFERDVARLLLLSGFEDVRLVGGVGDHGADILGVRDGELWVWQCKFTTTSPPPRKAIDEVVAAARFFNAERLAIATSRSPGDGFMLEKARHTRTGLQLQVAGPGMLLELAAVTPMYSHTRKTLRAYQVEAVECLADALLGVGRAQMVMATGLGKTIIIAELVTGLLTNELLRTGRVLVLAHTRELVAQLNRGFWHQLPRWVPTHQLCDGEVPTYWDGVTFATIQSAHGMMEALPEFDLVVVDEAHHMGAQTFRDLLAGLQPRMLVGVTATPWRGDSYDIDQLLGVPVVRLGIAEGLAHGFLSDVDYRLLADNIDWEFIQEKSRHRYSLPQLNRRLIIPTRDEHAAHAIREVFTTHKRRGGIVYSPTITHAKHFAGVLRHCGLRAEAISSEQSFRERDAMLVRFRAGQIDLVVTVDLFNEGVDVPDVDLIAFMRVTHNRRIFVQQLGRGLRLSPGKDKLIVLDFVTDLRRVAEIVNLDSAIRDEEVEAVGLGARVFQFRDASAGSFLKEWILDQASLIQREGDASLELPQLDFPGPPGGGGVQ
jgi:superfamily II DNA or RNA helicase/Holliday junction resolvase